jgi:hypothetical protein
MPAAKQKAQRILCVFSSIFATQMARCSRRSGAQAVRRGLCGAVQRKNTKFRAKKSAQGLKKSIVSCKINTGMYFVIYGGIFI